jgi:hypothetical protein
MYCFSRADALERGITRYSSCPKGEGRCVFAELLFFRVYAAEFPSGFRRGNWGLSEQLSIGGRSYSQPKPVIIVFMPCPIHK